MNALVSAAWQAVCDEPSDKLVLVYLADRANATRRAWPHLPTIVRQTGLSRSTIIVSIQRLETRGHLTVSRKQGCSNSYIVHPKADAPASPATRPVQPPHVTSPTAGRLPVQRLDQQPNHQRTVREAGRVAPKFKRELWQLLRDETTLKERLKAERESCKPDPEMVEALKVKLRELRDEMKGHPPKKIKESLK